jgi:hypothetical protein
MLTEQLRRSKEVSAGQLESTIRVNNGLRE